MILMKFDFKLKRLVLVMIIQYTKKQELMMVIIEVVVKQKCISLGDILENAVFDAGDLFLGDVAEAIVAPIVVRGEYLTKCKM
jgi:hypothetical protein